jgi:pimeloyl-ACP methyl ester carboxylesterase
VFTGPTLLGGMETAEIDRSPRAGLRRGVRLSAVVAAAGLTLGACATAPPSPYSDDAAPVASLPRVEDQRGRFREILCAILEQRASTLPDARPCDDALTRVGTEPEGTGRTVDLGPSDRRLVAAMVPGIGWDCFAAWLDMKETAVAHVRQFGYDLVAIHVDALSSSATNAGQIRDAIMAMAPMGDEPELVLIGYSKGTPDILEAVVSYPEIRPRVAAVVSVAGAVLGSPVADEVTQSKLELLRRWPGAECSHGDGGAIESLRPATRKAWLDENPLPREIPYYSLATCPRPGRISSVLKPSYNTLSKVDARNDGMVLFQDQLIPGSTFVGCVNADHWAVSVPIARSHPMVGSTLVDENDYPREALLEALLRFVEEDLSRRSSRRK